MHVLVESTRNSTFLSACRHTTHYQYPSSFGIIQMTPVKLQSAIICCNITTTLAERGSFTMIVHLKNSLPAAEQRDDMGYRAANGKRTD